MQNLIRDLRMHNRHQEALATGKVMPTEEALDGFYLGAAPKPRFTYSIVSDDRQSGWFSPDYGVRNDQTGLLMNDEPMSARRAERLLEELENPEVEL